MDGLPLTSRFAELMRDMITSPASTSINPSYFFSKLAKKWKEYAKYDQQDAHEFLRLVMNGVHDEISAHHRTATTPKAQVQSTSSPTSSSATSPRSTVIGGAPLDLMLHTKKNFFEHIFEGSMSSVIICETCRHVSRREDAFMDISLPITDQQVSFLSFPHDSKVFCGAIAADLIWVTGLSMWKA